MLEHMTDVASVSAPTCPECGSELSHSSIELEGDKFQILCCGLRETGRYSPCVPSVTARLLELEEKGVATSTLIFELLDHEDLVVLVGLYCHVTAVVVDGLGYFFLYSNHIETNLSRLEKEGLCWRLEHKESLSRPTLLGWESGIVDLTREAISRKNRDLLEEIFKAGGPPALFFNTEQLNEVYPEWRGMNLKA